MEQEGRSAAHNGSQVDRDENHHSLIITIQNSSPFKEPLDLD